MVIINLLTNYQSFQGSMNYHNKRNSCPTIGNTALVTLQPGTPDARNRIGPILKTSKVEYSLTNDLPDLPYLNDEFDCTNNDELLLLPSHYCIIDTELFAMKVTLDCW